MAYKKFVEGAALGAGLAVGLLAVAVIINVFAPSIISTQRAALLGR